MNESIQRKSAMASTVKDLEMGVPTGARGASRQPLFLPRSGLVLPSVILNYTVYLELNSWCSQQF
jgi:hypothetical protein